MKVSECSPRRILNPCKLDMYNYQIDTYMGCEHLCYYCYGLNDAETDWEEEVLVHGDFGERLSQELSGLEPQTIYIGTDNDPYQPSERTEKQTRQVLELLVERGFSVCVLTKSDLITRDIDLLKKMPDASAGISLAFQDEQTRQLFEKNAPQNRNRLVALEKMKGAGIDTYTMISPVMPYLTDVKALIEAAKPYSNTIWIYRLQLESEESLNWRNIQSILDKHFPDLTEKYREIAFAEGHSYWGEIRRELEGIREDVGVELRVEL